MKKLLIVFLSVGAILFSAKVVLADYASSYQDYINKTGTYQSTYNNYLTARSTYLASGSLDSKDKAKAATLSMLQARDNVVISYLTALESKVQNTLGISDGDKSSLTNQINTEITWHNNHNAKLPSAGSLEDLVTDSDEAKNQFGTSTSIAIYSNLINLGFGNNAYIRGELNSEISLLQAKVDEIKANQDKDVSVVERFIVEVQNKISRSQDKDNAAKSLVNSIKPSGYGSDTSFQTAQSDLTDSNSYLKEANQELLQIITQIKTVN